MADTPVKTAKPTCKITVSMEISKTGNSVPVADLKKIAAGKVANTPMKPPIRANIIDSNIIKLIIKLGWNPIALIVAYSLTLSLEVMAIVFALSLIHI